jgi:hypothetical protein
MGGEMAQNDEIARIDIELGKMNECTYILCSLTGGIEMRHLDRMEDSVKLVT